MSSSFDENVYNVVDERVADLDYGTSEGEPIDVDDEVSTKRAKTNHPDSSSQRRSRPPKIPKESNVSKLWCPGQPFVRNRKNASPHWSHFVQGDEVDFAKCLYCGDVLSCKSSQGTAPIANHVARCKKHPSNVDKKQKLISLETTTIVNEDGTTGTITVPSLWKFDQEKTRKSLAKMIVVDELPFSFVEGEGFQGFCVDMNPQFSIPSRFTVARDVYKLFIEERGHLKEFFGSMTSRVCLTTDCWTSGQNLGYMCLTAHFIDADWNLHKRIINFCQIAGHSGAIIGKTVEKCLSEWNLKNVLTVTVDNASSNDLAVDYLRRKLNNSECDVLEGKFLHMRCAAHILNLVVRDGLTDLAKSVVKIRALVKFVRASPGRFQKFKACALEEKIESKSHLSLDVETRWNSTYLMLESALKYKKAFGCMLVNDLALQKEMRKFGNEPTNEEWRQVSYFLPFLKIFYDATLKMSASLYVTSNIYVEVIFGVGEVLAQHMNDEDEGVRKMASQMKVKYDKYWGKIDNLNLFLFASLILDPRWKMVRVEWMVKSAYGIVNGSHLAGNIRFFFREFFEFYASSTQCNPCPSSSSSTSTNSSTIPSKDKSQDKLFNFGAVLSKKFDMENGGKELENKSELDKYLEDARESTESPLKLLQWWKDNQKRYPILSKMARDVLAIPVSTVASESAFSTGGRILDSFRTSLAPYMVEALICGQDWLRTSHTPLIIEDHLFEMAKIQEGMEHLMLQQPTIVIDDSHDTDD